MEHVLQDAKWRLHRKHIQPTFSTTILQSFTRIFSAQSVKIADEMKRHLDGSKFDISEYTTQWALLTSCATTMGVNLGAQTNGNNYYAEMAEKDMARVCIRVVRRPWLYPNFIFYRTQLGKDQQRYIKYLHAFTDTVIQQKKKDLLGHSHPRPGLPDNEDDIGDCTPGRKVFLDHLIEVSRDVKMLSDEALREEVDTIMGTDTTAVTSSYVMLMLASHPEVQERVYQELCEIYGDDDGEESEVTPEDLTRMTYMERVIKETLRLFPIVPFIVRKVTEDLDTGEHTFPAGSQVFLSIIELHRNGDIWPDPFKFDPDRFFPEEVKNPNPFTYLPFSSGPRICISSKYAMKTLFATILRFKWEFVMRPVDPITIRCENRSRKVAAI